MLAVILVFGVCPLRAVAAECDLYPKELLLANHRTYAGLYQNRAYDYAVQIPKGLIGYDVPDPSYQHGFTILLGSPARGAIELSGEPNSLELRSPEEFIEVIAEALAKGGRTTTSASTREAHLGQLKAVRSIVKYRCGSTSREYVDDSVIALSPDGTKLYQITLRTTGQRYRGDLAVFDRVLRGWSLID